MAIYSDTCPNCGGSGGGADPVLSCRCCGGCGLVPLGEVGFALARVCEEVARMGEQEVRRYDSEFQTVSAMAWGTLKRARGEKGGA